MAKVRVSILYLTALLLAGGYPMMAMADTPPDAAVTTPVASTDTPPAPTYTYNPATQTWDSNTWHFNPVTGKYEPVPVPIVIDTPPAVVSAPTTPSSTDPTVTTDPTTTAKTDVTTGVDITNTIGADATTGNATVAGNTTGGSATTGDATSAATVLNTVNSTIAAGDNQKAATFTYNVLGDVNGDVMLYPMLLKTMLESQAASASTLTANQNNTINNTVDLNATSGNATVTGNTSAGNATTGAAHTVANVVNILNSMISANQSFIGTINIYGSLNGDILVAPDFIPQMIASNSQLQTPQTASTTSVTTNDTQSIVNNIALAAKSGSAAVLDNTSAGSATTGSADTNVVIFNLSGHAVIAKDSLLVFVNVLGKWIGVIVDAPTGATSALIGNGVVSDATTIQPDLKVSAQTTNAITNTITLAAQSGDATVQNNTLAGNAKTGNATSSANVANIVGSQLGLSQWFGVLFINVFGSWSGSFGVNTAAGDPPVTIGGEATTPGVISFVPKSTNSQTTVRKVTLIDSGQLADTTAPVDSAVLAATDIAATPTPKLIPTDLAAVSADYRWPIIIGSMLVIGVTIVGISRLLAGRAEG
jgi:hypothetical protein